MTPRHKRIGFIIIGLFAIATASVVVVMAMQNYTSYFYNSTQIVNNEAPVGKLIRIGGMVKENSMQRKPGDLEVAFIVTDMSNEVTVRYSGILPDLFKEGGGAVARGELNQAGEFMAEEIMAKHDESYMPPEVAELMQHKQAEQQQ